MSALAIQPSKLMGAVAAPPSKSCAHRALIAASLASGRSIVRNIELSQDMIATLDAVRALGAAAEAGAGEGGPVSVAIDGIARRAGMPGIDCRESGSTLRFMIPVSSALCGGAAFTGAARLFERPLGPYFRIFEQQGIEFERRAAGLAVRGELRPGVFTVPGNVSSQFVTGLLLAAPLLSGESTILIDGPLESKPYVDVTIDVLARFGVEVEEMEPGARYRVAPQAYKAYDYTVEGDWSQAAFPLLMGLLGGSVSVSGLEPGSRQGDKIIESIFSDMGGDIRWEGGALVARRSRLGAVTADVSQCPDLAPAIAAAMAVAEGVSRITGGTRLRAKESDRLQSIAACLNALGGDVAETGDGLAITGKPILRGGSAASQNDHRIAMMAAAVSPACSGTVVLEGYEAVAKSWPGFWQVFGELGGNTDGQPLG